jgi:hypothetical protein
MNLAWIAAVLSPFEVAPHPNFGSASGYRPESDLALFVMERSPSWDSIERRMGAFSDNPPVDEGVRLIYDTFHDRSTDQSVDIYEYLLTYPADGDSARRTALTLLACVLAGASDDFTLCDRLIQSALEGLSEGEQGADLCRAVLLQQLALRRFDAGESAVSASVDVATLLDQIDPEACGDFELNGVTPMTASEVISRVVEALKRAAWSTAGLDILDPNGIGPIPSRRDQLFKAESGRLSRIKGDELSEYYRVIENSFGQLFDRTSRTVMGGRNPDLFFEMLAYELYGHAGVTYVRKQVAMMRSIQGFPFLVDVNLGNSLRLLRQATAEAELRQLIAHVESSGPLLGVVDDARRILANRRRVDAIRAVELVVLAAAADFLGEPEAAEVLDLIFAVIDQGGPVDPPGRWQIDSTRYETASASALAVGEAVGSVGRVADHLLQSLTAERISDELWDRAFASVIRRIDWDSIPDTTRAAWREVLQADEFSKSISARTFDRDLPPEAEPIWDPAKAYSLAECAELINQYLRHGQAIPDVIVDRASELAQRGVARIRSDAPNSYGKSVPDPAEMMTVLALETDRHELWEPLLGFLSDANVPQTAKRRSFDLLVVEKVDIDSQAFANYRNALLEVVTGADPFAAFDGRTGVIFPAAMRFAAVYEIIDGATVFNYIWTLATADDRFNRIEAARSLQAFVRNKPFDWLLTVALQLSYDVFPEVKVQAIDVLSGLVHVRARDLPTAADRLGELLDDDGVLIPLTVLQAISVRGVTDARLRAKAKALRSGHLSRRVRLAAADIGE